jgi:hypothetical protein
MNPRISKSLISKLTEASKCDWIKISSKDAQVLLTLAKIAESPFCPECQHKVNLEAIIPIATEMANTIKQSIEMLARYNYAPIPLHTLYNKWLHYLKDSKPNAKA